ncbi:MAG TPA: hypothetical protein VNO23_05765 [Candidatus Binatia bacterium]|nr:hypothetical protein [Candidatus Binatia bacterium]
MWLAYLAWPGDEAFRTALRPLRCGGAATVATFATASVLPLVLGLLGIALSRRADLMAALAGVLLIAGQVRLKSALIREAGQLRPVTIARLTVGRRPA